eukprot:TRINITY_DN7841_c0_g1_i1.p1 TRINITY_DN7841_c0_g1~~TRINITY_DN7841_c0_g1_i1.p1  ORF type:complete len:152 (-),score=34.79 TRINITY_DN7841_c0_g1_i1:151-606(-)
MDIENKIKEEKMETIRRTNVRILIAEDNHIYRRLIGTLLRRLGYTNVLIVEDGKKAVEEIKKNNRKNQNNNDPFEMILMDNMMPVMGGLKATMMIRNDPTVLQPTIVGWISYGSTEDLVTCKEVGMNSVLRKPVMLKDLNDIIEKVKPLKK